MKKKNVLHILASGNAGGIEVLCRDYSLFSENNNIFLFPWSTGEVTDEMVSNGNKVICLNASKKKFLWTSKRYKKNLSK